MRTNKKSPLKRILFTRHRALTFGVLIVLAAILVRGEGPAAANQDYDVVIVNGRVMDSETGLNAVRNVGINAGKIAVISEAPLTGKTTIDAKGLVVAPGFIDLHEHGA
jgi:adenine deaminase